MRHDNGYACMCPPDYTDYNCAATIDIRVEGVASDNNEGDIFVCFISKNVYRKSLADIVYVYT